MKIGTLIKTVRTARGIPQKEFSGRLNVSTNYLSLLENGRRNPSQDLVKKVASVLEISVDALEFLSTEIPKELDSENSLKYQSLQENIATLLIFKSQKVA